MLYLVQSITLRELIKLLPFVSIISLPEVERWGTQRVNNNMKEIWKPVPLFEESYKVSNFGRVKSIKRIIKVRTDKTKRNYVYSGQIRVTHINKFGYRRIKLTVRENSVYRQKSYVIHRLVAMVFIPNPKNKPQVNHIDGNKLNNNVSNLEWCTAKENIRHAFRTGLYKKPITNEQVKELRKYKTAFLNKELTLKQIGDKFGIDLSTAGKMLRNQSRTNNYE